MSFYLARLLQKKTFTKFKIHFDNINNVFISIFVGKKNKKCQLYFIDTHPCIVQNGDSKICIVVNHYKYNKKIATSLAYVIIKILKKIIDKLNEKT